MMDWTRPDTLNTLRGYWCEGLSASQIGKLMGCSRNAIIGAVHRNLPDLPKRSSMRVYAFVGRPDRPPRRQRAPTVRRALAPAASEPLPPDLKAIAAMKPLDERLSVLKLSELTCRYPIGDPLTPGFAFCGRTCEAERAYCVHHHALCYRPVDPKRVKGTARLANWLDRASFAAAA